MRSSAVVRLRRHPRWLAQMVPVGDRGESLEMLRHDGCSDTRPSDAYLCKHESKITFYLYNILGAICFPDDSPETLADIGWEVMTGCRDCMVSFLSVLRHGGHDLGLQIFEEDQDVPESLGLPAYKYFPDATLARRE